MSSVYNRNKIVLYQTPIGRNLDVGVWFYDTPVYKLSNEELRQKRSYKFILIAMLPADSNLSVEANVARMRCMDEIIFIHTCVLSTYIFGGTIDVLAILENQKPELLDKALSRLERMAAGVDPGEKSGDASFGKDYGVAQFLEFENDSADHLIYPYHVRDKLGVAAGAYSAYFDGDTRHHSDDYIVFMSGRNGASWEQTFNSYPSACKELAYLRVMQPLDFTLDIERRGYKRDW